MIDKFTSLCSVDTDIPQSGGVFSKIVGALSGRGVSLKPLIFVRSWCYAYLFRKL